MKRSPWRVLAATCIVTAGFCLVAVVIVISLRGANVTERDFIEYWAAEQQFIHGANPYDAAQIFRLERAEGLTRREPELWFSPPVMLFLMRPLGLLSAHTGLIVWSLLLVASLSLSVWILWQIHGRPPTLLHLFGFLFAPVLVCIQAAQIGIFLLLSVLVFLYFRDSRRFLAGAALLPCALKPHLFLPFAIVLLLWVFSRKAYGILAGFLLTLFVSCGLTTWYDPHIWLQYSSMMGTAGALNHFVPTLSASLRFLIDPNAVWLQFLPEGVACVWAAWYFWTRRNRWNWLDQGMVLLLVSVLCAPYAYFTDESVLLPAVMTGVVRAMESRRSVLPIVFLAGTALIEAHAVVQIISRYYLWTAPAWLGWYLYATWGNKAQGERVEGSLTELAESK